MGWVFALLGLSILLSGVAGELADRGLVVFGALGGAFWFSWLAAVGLLVLWYPTGKVPGRVWVDRRFNRSRYDAERVVDEFAGSLRERLDTDDVVEGWLGVVHSTMQPAAVGVWIKGGS